MNAYLCIAEDVPVLQETIDSWGRYEDENLVELVFAESRGQAKSTFLQRHRMDYVEFTDIDHVRLVGHDVDCTRGLASYSDPIWDRLEPYGTTLESDRR